jgi:hypothetical protein
MSDEKKKNIHAVALGRLGGKGRAAALSSQELSEIGKHGARQRLTKVSKAERSRIASIAAKKRWQKKKA